MAIKRGIIVILGLLLQILFFLFLYIDLAEHFILISSILKVLGFLLILWLIKYSKSYSYILPWIIIILLFPLVGTLLYLIIGYNKKSSKLLKRIVSSENSNKKYLIQDKNIRKEIQNNSGLRYITDYINYPVTTNNDVKYYPLGELGYKEMLKELKKELKNLYSLNTL